MSTTNSQVQSLYVAYFGRPADPAGLNFWTQTGSNTLQQQSNAFATAPEWTTAIRGMTNDQVVNLIYINAFGHAPDAAGLRFWSDAITNSIITVGTAAWQIVTNTGTADKIIIDSKIAASTGYTAAVTASTTDSVAYGNSAAFASANTWLDAITTPAQATAALVPATLDASLATMVTASNTSTAQTFTLTTGIDALGSGAFIGGEPTGNSVINAVDAGTGGITPTWSSLDSITATGTNNVFNVASSQNISNPAGSVVTGVQTMTATQGGTTQTITLNTTAFTGLTQLSVDNVGTGLNTLTASATTNVTDTQGLGGASLINGGLNVSVTKAQTGAGAVTFGTIGIGATTAAAGTVTVTNTDTVTAATGGVNVLTVIGVTGGNGVTITDTVNSIVAGSTTNTVTFTQKGTNGAVVINNNTNATTTAAAIALTGNAVTVAGSATATDAGATTITVNNTATASQVAVTPSTVTQGTVTITGGTATTAVTVNQTSTATAAATVTAVAGVVGVTAVTAAPGVTGVTTVAAVTARAAVTGKAGVVAGQVVIADVNGSNQVANTLATVTLAAIGTTSSITSSALTTLNLSGVSTTSATLLITDSLNTHVNTNVLALNTTAATGGVIITAAKVATLNITNSGTSVLGAFTDANLTAVTVAGSGVITLGANSATTETVTGAAGVTQTIDNTVVTFNAAGTTGTSTITTATAGTKVITAGSGGLDELILTVNNTYTTTTGGKFVGFEKLGLAANITQDASVFGAGINVLDITTTAQTSVITKLNTGASINLKAAATTTTALTVSYVDTTGINDTTTITFAGPTASTIASGAAQTITTLSLDDANNVGVGTLNIVDNNVAFNYAGDNITNLVNTGGTNFITTLNVSGAGGFSIGGTAGTTAANFVNTSSTMTIGNTGTNVAGLVMAMTDDTLGNLTFTGSGKTTLTLADAVAGTLNITNSGTGTVVVTDAGVIAANINLTGAMTATFTDAHLASMTLRDGQAVNLTASQASIAAGANSGFTLSGAANNSRVALTLGAAAVTKTNTVTLGNGNNNISDATIAGTSTITVGTGSNLIKSGLATTNTSGLFNVTVGTRASATVGNEIIAGTGGTNYATVANYVLTGLTTGDQVAFLADAASIASGNQVATSLTGAANVAGAISTLQTAAHAIGIHGTAWGVYLGNTYVVEDSTGTLGATTTTVVELAGLSSTTTGALTFSNGGFTIGSTGTAPVVDSGASHTFALAVAQTYTSSYTGAYAITQAAGAGASVTLSGSTASGTVDLTGATGTSTINTSATSGIFTLTGAASIDTISVGTGATTVIGAAGADVINLIASHAAIDTILYNAITQGGALTTVGAGTVLATGDTITNFVVAQDLINVNGVAGAAAHLAGTGVQNGWDMHTTNIFIETGTYLAAGATAAQVATAIGTATATAGDVGFVLLQTAAASGTYQMYQVTDVTTHAAAAFSGTDTISLVGTFTAGAANAIITANLVA
ncbi:MAG: hypothetical protein NTU70_07815 [Methylococcales bacterium]|nr:hypothetical protein [Methylococcales bacterium]